MKNSVNVKNFILSKLRLYSTVYSRSGEEKEFYNLVKKDFFEINPSFTIREVYENNKFSYALFKSSETFPYIFTVHLDRVGKYVNTIQDDGELLRGQLDDIIGIAILAYISIECGINILFTTAEEYCSSWPQLAEIAVLNPKMKLISIDIDVFRSLEEISEGFISLRLYDSAGQFNKELVTLMRHCASKYNIPYCTEDKGWSYVETSMLEKYTGSTGAHIGIPLINYHTDKEVTYWKTIINCVSFINYFIINERI